MCFSVGTRAELHFHLLPDVDDGPPTLVEALELARMAVADGTRLVVCTPHVHLVDVRTLPDRLRELQSALRAAGIALQVRVGGEITAGTALTAAEIEIVAQGPPGRRWVLLEAPLEGRLVDAFHADADTLQAAGYGVLIAHPERCDQLMAADGGLEHRLSRGARLQVNASSVIGAHGAPSAAHAMQLIARGAVAVLASDAHGPQRPPVLGAALRVLAERRLDDDALVAQTPWRLLSGGIAAVPGRHAA